jgi:hypothetical protein
MTENYKKAFTEVHEIINYLDEKDYNKIPIDVRRVIEENRDKEYQYFVDESMPLIDQKMLPETKAILFNFFKDYFATYKQKEKILRFQLQEMIKLENKS